MKCGFCSDVATGECAVSITEPRIHMPDELKVGDLIQVFWDLQFHMIKAKVGTTFRVGLKRKVKRSFELTPTLPVLVLASNTLRNASLRRSRSGSWCGDRVLPPLGS